MRNKIIITADDYGACDRIDSGILKAIEKNKLTSISMMVTHGDIEEIRRRLSILVNTIRDNEGAQKVGIGLHLSLTSGIPIKERQGNSLVDETSSHGEFRRIFNYDFRNTDPFHMRDELNAQYELLANELDKYQMEVDHITNHHGLVYFEERLFNEYVSAAKDYSAPIRSPMSWYRKFKKFDQLPDFDKVPLTNATMRRGLKIGMWRKLAQMSYGNLLKRMNQADYKGVNYPDVLCEYFYGQCEKGEENNGDKVFTHVLQQYLSKEKKDKLNEERKRRDRIKNWWQGIQLANENTVDKSDRSRQFSLEHVRDKYRDKVKERELSIELMMHLAFAHESNKNEPVPHGINEKYFDMRDGELEALLNFDVQQQIADFGMIEDLDLANFREL